MHIRLEQKSGQVREAIRVLIYHWNHEYLKDRNRFGGEGLWIRE